MDTTTNWAISAAGGLVTISLSNEGVPHATLLVALPFLLFFLAMEARRFRYYEMSRVRTRFLEQSYFADVLKASDDVLWLAPFLASLKDPRPSADLLAAVGWRLRRNYLAIFLAILTGWLIKLQLLGGPQGDPGVLIERAAIGPVPGLGVALAVLCFGAWLIVVAMMAPQRYPQGEEW
jgi:uncharacterized membrane protein